MPTYDYMCLRCGKIVEKYHSIKDNPMYKCEKCNTVLERQIGSGSGIIFKGTGFYETDYKEKND